MFVRRVFIRSFEVGLLFRDGEFRGLLGAGRHWFFDPLGKLNIVLGEKGFADRVINML